MWDHLPQGRHDPLDVNKKGRVVVVKAVTTLGKEVDGAKEKLHKTLFRWS